MITKEDIEKLAKLARIELAESELQSLAKEADAILGYVSQIENISGEIEKELPHLRNVMRSDAITHAPGEYTKSILANAPSVEKNYLKVKKILK
jgi:aspartyl-tRNA(Asn)/glutamyl-tRNA(Gln) amidotransferase subunit C